MIPVSRISAIFSAPFRHHLASPPFSNLVSAFAGLSVFSAYLLTLAPDITWAYQGADGGDLITAATTLGVPHPSGYPTYVLLSWLFSQVPIGLLAWRFNLLSALAVSGAAWFIFKIVRQLTDSPVAALAAAWLFAFTPLVWSQAIITEVYGLHLFFTCLLLWCGLQVRLGARQYPFFLGLFFGLALGVHLTILFLTPLLLWLTRKQMRPHCIALTLGGLLGLSVFVYLPLRAGQGAITWGSPTSWPGFFDLVFGRIYHGYLFSLPWPLVGPRFLELIGYVTAVGFLGLLCAVVGGYWVWCNARNTLYWATLVGICYVLYAIGYRTADSYVYLMPLFVFISIAAGLGIKAFAAHISSTIWYSAGCVGILLWLLIAATFNGQQLSLREDRIASQFLKTMLSEAPSQAVLLTYADKHTFTLWYAHYALQQRPDIAIVDTGLLTFDWYRQDLKRHYPHLTELATLADLFQQGAAYAYPLCVVREKEQAISWSLDCLIPETE